MMFNQISIFSEFCIVHCRVHSIISALFY